MGIVIGIDLGTTYSVVSRYFNNEIHYVRDESDSLLIPSVVCNADELYVGREAVENEEDYPSDTIRSSKRYIGSNLNDYPHRMPPTEVATHILKYLKTIAEKRFNETVDGAVITVPAYFNQNQRVETKKAAENAQLKVLRIINEPTSAALAYGTDAKTNELVLVYDLGGGTFDVTLLTLTDDQMYQVLSTSGDTKLGGDDFDNLIVNDFLSTLPQDFKPFRDFSVRLKKFAEEVKIQLNYKTKIKKTLKYCGVGSDKKIYHHTYCLEADKYLEMVKPLLLKTKTHVLNALNDASTKISKLDKIILVGGSTKSKFVREFISKEFNTRVYHEIDPDLTVSFGAAKLASSITNKNQDGTLLIDVTPLSLGIEVKGGLLNKIIPRNTTIPTAAAQEYITAEDNQESVVIKIYQGERPLAANNEFLGEFELSGFEKRPKGQTIIVVQFDIDASGMITVSAFDKISGLQSNVTLKPLTSDKINEILDNMEISDDKKALKQIELQQLQSTAKTLITMKKLIHHKDLEETYISLKDNLDALKVFVQELQEI